MKVLLVEDEEYTRNGIVRSIPWSELGIDEVVTAEDGQEGLSRALAEQPQIIITDMRMPRMNGHEMASIIRECLSDCSFIFISGFTDVSYFKSAISLSAVDYIIKPIDIEELVKVLTSAIAIQNEKARDNRKNERTQC
jgi:two-component system response regulator YesN